MELQAHKRRHSDMAKVDVVVFRLLCRWKRTRGAIVISFDDNNDS